ncbi:MAG: FAD-dependent oxidoreductase [Caldilineaceae bacterium]
MGQLEIAVSDARRQDLIRLHGEAQAFGCEAHLLTPAEARQKLPIVDETQFVGALRGPSAIVKGAMSPALARDAQAMGVEFAGHTGMTDIEVKDGHVTAVLTDNPEMPRIECEAVLLCANIWAPALSEKLGVHLPLLAFEHQYVRTKPLPQLAQFARDNKDHEVVYPTTRTGLGHVLPPALGRLRHRLVLAPAPRRAAARWARRPSIPSRRTTSSANRGIRPSGSSPSSGAPNSTWRAPSTACSRSRLTATPSSASRRSKASGRRSPRGSPTPAGWPSPWPSG